MIFPTQSGHAYVAAPETPQNDAGRNVLHKTSNLAMARCCFANTWSKLKNARAGRAKLLFLPTKYAN